MNKMLLVLFMLLIEILIQQNIVYYSESRNQETQINLQLKKTNPKKHEIYF
jgi:hypothetical protein